MLYCKRYVHLGLGTRLHPSDDNKWCPGGYTEYVPGDGHLNACLGGLEGIIEACPREGGGGGGGGGGRLSRGIRYCHL